MNDKIKKFLKKLHNMPGAFLGKKSLERLAFSLAGYAFSLYENGEIETPEPLPGFNEFVANRYNIQSTHDWCSIIEFHHPVEDEAFDKFYELLSDFFGNMFL